MVIRYRDHITGAMRKIGDTPQTSIMGTSVSDQRHIELQESHEKTRQDLLDVLDRLHTLERSHLDLLDSLDSPSPPSRMNPPETLE